MKKENILKFTITTFCTALVILFFIWMYYMTVGYVTVTQHTRYDSRTDCTYWVCTHLNLNSWNRHMEKRIGGKGFKKSEIKAEKIRQMKIMRPYKEALELALKCKCD